MLLTLKSKSIIENHSSSDQIADRPSIIELFLLLIYVIFGRGFYYSISTFILEVPVLRYKNM